MAALGYHIVLAAEDRRVLLRDARQRRVFASAVHRIGDAFGLLAVGAADNHAHMTAVCGRREAGVLAHNLECSLRWRLELEVPFAAARIRAIEDRRHLHNSFFYDLRQHEKHGLVEDPFHEASSLPDLLGLRVLGTGIRERVASLLPRVRTRQLRERLAWPHDGTTDLACLADAAAAALGLTDLHDNRRRDVRRAVAAAIHAAEREGSRALCVALGCSQRFVMKVRREAAEPATVRAVTGQWRLRSTRGAASTLRSPVSWTTPHGAISDLAGARSRALRGSGRAPHTAFHRAAGA